MSKKIKGYGVADPAKCKAGEVYSLNKQRGKKARGGYPFTDACPLELITEWRDYSNGLSQRRLGWFFHENSFFLVRASNESVIPFDDDDDNCALKLASRVTIEEQLSVGATVQAQIDFARQSSTYEKYLDKVGTFAFSKPLSKLLIDGRSINFSVSGWENTIVLNKVSGVAYAASSGPDNIIVSNTDGASMAASGDESGIINSGIDAAMAVSGNSCDVVSDGNKTNIAAAGFGTTIDNFGDNAKIAITGNAGTCNALGENNVVAIVGMCGHFSGKIGTHVCVAQYLHGKCIGFVTGEIGKNGLKPDVTYTTHDGQFIELQDQPNGEQQND